jgi:hypothetical protein
MKKIRKEKNDKLQENFIHPLDARKIRTRIRKIERDVIVLSELNQKLVDAFKLSKNNDQENTKKVFQTAIDLNNKHCSILPILKRLKSNLYDLI